MHTRLLLSTILAIAGIHSFASTANACGGFFCNNAQPVNQAAERIIFSQNPDGTTTAAIQIQYSGPSESFAWMLPVVGSPEISVSSNVAFTRLQSATNPSYALTVDVEGECSSEFFPDSGVFFADAAANDAGPSADAGPPVTVVDSGSVGPYDFVIISVDPGAADVAAVATEWLNDNMYDVSEFGRDRLVPYLESGMNLLAFRLTKGREAGEIRPVVLSFGTGLPSIPLRPTAAAATPDMGIMVFVVGESRAIPANYLDLELNEARIDWMNNASNYNDVVTLAANEAGGQGFVTEFAGAAEPLSSSILQPFETEQWERIATIDREWTQLLDTASLFAGWDGLSEALLAELTKPAGVSDEDWVLSPLSFLSPLVDTDTGDVPDFDFAPFAARIEAEVLGPVRDTAALFSAGRTLTRFYTTMSSEEMTMDPVFDFNAELGDYSNVHTAQQTIECSEDVTRSEAPWRVLLADGTLVRGDGRSWPLATSDTLPAARTTRRVGNTGEGQIVTNNAALIASVVAAHNGRDQGGGDGGGGGGDAGPGGSDAGPGGSDGSVGGGGCSVGTGGPSALSLFFLLALFWRRRR